MNEDPEEDLNAEEEEARRYFAEKIIAGEYKAVALVILDQEGGIHTWYAGGYIAALGLFRHGEKSTYDRHMRDTEEE